jgi:predicted enzyme related to lactoylglutathione lyase
VEPVGQWGWLQVDCADPLVLARFWSLVLGEEIDQSLGEPVQYLGLVPRTPGRPVLSFQRVAEPRRGKNRLHLDIEVLDVDSATARIIELGGRRIGVEDFAEYGFRWRVMADPEGNEFCLIY